MNFKSEITAISNTIENLKAKQLENNSDITVRKILDHNINVLTNIRDDLKSQHELYIKTKRELDALLESAKNRDALLS